MGRKIDPEVVKGFQEGKTTRAEVAKALGEPFNRSYLDQGRQEMWMYLYSESHARINPATIIVPVYSEVNTQTTSQSLTLTFNGDLLGKIDWTPYGYPGAVPPVATAPAATAPAAAVAASPAAEGEPQPAAAPVAEASPSPSTSSPAATPATGGLAVPVLGAGCWVLGVGYIRSEDPFLLLIWIALLTLPNLIWAIVWRRCRSSWSGADAILNLCKDKEFRRRLYEFDEELRLANRSPKVPPPIARCRDEDPVR